MSDSYNEAVWRERAASMPKAKVYVHPEGV